jgi:hypothetical protein
MLLFVTFVSNMWKKKMYSGFWCENLMEKDHLENLGVEQRIQLKWVSNK